jgi:protein O-mannosyl-transferase
MVRRSVWNRGGVPAPRVLLTALTAAAFASAIPNGFVWIDHWQIESGGLIAHSWAEFWQAIRQPLGAMPGWEGTAPYARPTVIAALSAVHAVAGTQPAAYHALSVSVHLANVLLLYGVLGDLAVPQTAAFLTSALFAVHPVQTAAVSWISGIADPLFALFVLAAFRLQLVVARRTPRAHLLQCLSLLAFTLALGSKETAAIFPFLLLAAYLMFPAAVVRRSAAASLAGWQAILPFLVVLAGAGAYRWGVLHGTAFGGMAAFPFSVRVQTVPRLLLSYLTLPLRFTALTVCDDYRVSTSWDGAAVGALAALVALIGCAIAVYKRQPHPAFALFWILLALVPVLNLVPILHYRADRFFYFPMIGWALGAVMLTRWVVGHAPRRLADGLAFAGMGVIVVLGALTVRRNLLFADDITLFASTVQVSPLCLEAHTALGDAYLRAGRVAEAVEHYQRARAPQPDRASYVVVPKVLINLGMAEMARHEYAAAAAVFAQAHALQPQLLHPLFGLGIANLAQGRTAAGVQWLEQARAIDPSDPDVTFNLALGYDRVGRSAEAVTLYRQYLSIAEHGRARALAEGRLRALRGTEE